jgi:RNA polymerase sigma-B factor
LGSQTPPQDSASPEIQIEEVQVEAVVVVSETVTAEEEDEEEEEEHRTPPPSPFVKAPPPSRPAEGEFERLFAEWKATGDPRLRERLILMHRNLVTYLARRFMDRGELFEDVMQIGMLGLINALDAFDPNRGVKFSTFATPTIAGEIRRYFRDKVSGMRVPRRMQELYGVIQNKVEELTQKLDRSPTYTEIAFALEIEVEEVIETLELSNALEPMSLDDAVFGDKDPSPTFLADTIGGPDPALESYEEHAALQMALSRLSEKERKVLEMAYFHGHSQAEIARRLGVSQMHISRLLRKALAQLRHLLEDG